MNDALLRIRWFLQGDWWLTKFGQWLCERNGHADVIWYSSGLEPDMHCKRCGRDLG